jgi:peroxiredoxin
MNTIFRFCVLFASLSLAHGFFCFQKTVSRSLSTSIAASSVETMTAVEEVKAGDKIPSMVLQEGLPDFGGKNDIDIAELIAGKKVVIFGVPGAFTPGCSKSHLPSFITAKDDLKEKGIDMVICIATNDLYVMEAWGRTSGGRDADIKFLSDGSGELTAALGLTMETPMMPRTKRFSLIAEDGVVTEYFSSAEESSNTWAPAVLSKL